MATVSRIDLEGGDVALRLAQIVRAARLLVGWTQRELAGRAEVAQATVCRIESGTATTLDLLVVGRLLTALGLKAAIDIDDFRLDDRRRQRDGVHALVNGFSARCLERMTWRTRMEAMIGHDVARGWIDLLAFREVDRALIVQETKTDIPDMGGLQRSVAFYERSALSVARGLGWDARSVTVLVVLLDSEAVARRLRDNREVVSLSFPASVRATAAWLADPSSPMPRGWTIGTCDPGSRSAAWLRPTTLGSRRTAPVYHDYADAAARLCARDRPTRADRQLDQNRDLHAGIGCRTRGFGS